MKAIIHRQYGSPELLRLQDTDKPAVPSDGVLVRVHAAAVNPLDWHTVTGTPYVVRAGSGLRRPKQPMVGVDFAGTVEAVGADVTRFRPGDEVFGGRTGAFAEYLCVREDRAVVHKPANVTFEQAAAVPVAALTALQGLRDKGRIQSGHRVLINGASGGVGTFAVQIAKAFGASVTGVCRTGNVELVRSIGADHVVDYTREDFTRDGRRYDLVLDIAGNRAWSDRKRVLDRGAILVVVGGPKTNPWVGPLGQFVTSRFVVLGEGRKVVAFITKMDRADLVMLQELLETGKVTSVIDRRYPLDQVPDALNYVGTGHARAKVVITG